METLKPFDLEAAKAGAKVVTRGGQPVRIICTDRKGSGYPIVALVTGAVREEIATYTITGRSMIGGGIFQRDLFMAPGKRQGWVYLRKIFGDIISSKVYGEKERAESIGLTYGDYIATVPVEWEE